MANGSENDTDRDEKMVDPVVTRKGLDANWIGLGAALYWILCRGQPLSREAYEERMDQADEQFVALMADAAPDIAESVVRGVVKGSDGVLKPIPSGIWRQVSSSDANDRDKVFRLFGTDPDFRDGEFDGSIHMNIGAKAFSDGSSAQEYQKIQVRTKFILENWPEHETAIEPVHARPTAARAHIRRLVEFIIAETPANSEPVSQYEMVALIKEFIPNARRNAIREIYGEIIPNRKTGPKASRNPNRPTELKELRQKIRAAQLHN